jgi:hypothetical protein
VSSGVAGLSQRLELVLGLKSELARRAVEELFDALRLEVEEYVSARHAELQRQGESNARIFERIARELPELRFKAPALTSRQIRRMIYG